jgi:hypothetical protein
MYGIFNKGLCDFITQLWGKEKWDKIRELSAERYPENNVEDFIAVDPSSVYNDAVTWAIFWCAAEVLELSYEVFLQKFGKYWITEGGWSG